MLLSPKVTETCPDFKYCFDKPGLTRCMMSWNFLTHFYVLVKSSVPDNSFFRISRHPVIRNSSTFLYGVRCCTLCFDCILPSKSVTQLEFCWGIKYLVFKILYRFFDWSNWKDTKHYSIKWKGSYWIFNVGHEHWNSRYGNLTLEYRIFLQFRHLSF